MKEIERKYIAALDPAKLPSTLTWQKKMDIEQGYVIATKAVEWRIRDTTYFIPAKGRQFHTALKFGNGYIRREYEVQVPRWVFFVLREFAGHMLFKTRWTIGGWEIDQFLERFYGLILAEYEVATAACCAPPLIPGLTLVKDVTESGEYANKRLARMSATAAYRLVRASLRASLRAAWPKAAA